MFHVLVFPVGVGYHYAPGIATVHVLCFCQFRKIFREKIECISFFAKKVFIYAVVYMTVIMLLAICNRVFYDSPFFFCIYGYFNVRFFWFCHESGFWTISAIITHLCNKFFE